MADIFRSWMVIPRDVNVPVWGWADPGEEITLSFAGQVHQTVADQDGDWEIILAPLAPGEPYELHVQGKNEILLTRVAVGDVWLVAGQSNMGFTVAAAAEKDQLLGDARNLLVRGHIVDVYVGEEPSQDITGKVWSTDSYFPHLYELSAIGYAFAKRLQPEIDAPVGFVQCAVGATMAEMWISSEALAEQADYTDAKRRYDSWINAWPHEDVYPDFANHVEAYFVLARDEYRRLAHILHLADALGTEVPEGTVEAYGIHRSAYRVYKRYPSGLYNGMIAPLARFPFKGVLWYQGESNTDEPHVYLRLLKTLVEDWRRTFGNPDLPFFITNLAYYGHVPATPIDDRWAEIREAQWFVCESLANVHGVNIVDLGDENDIHPPYKVPVAERFLAAVKNEVYQHDDIPVDYPEVDHVTTDGSEVTVTFSNVYDGLKTADGNPPTAFALSDAAGNWYWADARIEGLNQVVLASPYVQQPGHVRYAWAQNPGVNLCNSEDLPVVPFRTDFTRQAYFKVTAHQGLSVAGQPQGVDLCLLPVAGEDVTLSYTIEENIEGILRENVSGQIVIPAGQSEVTIPLQAITRPAGGPQTLTFNLQDGADYSPTGTLSHSFELLPYTFENWTGLSHGRHAQSMSPLLLYAMGLVPDSTSTDLQLYVDRTARLYKNSANQLTLTFKRPEGISGVNYQLVSRDLPGGAETLITPLNTRSTVSNGVETVEYTLPAPAANSGMIYELKLSLAE